MNEIESEKLSFSSRDWKNDSRWPLQCTYRRRGKGERPKWIKGNGGVVIAWVHCWCPDIKDDHNALWSKSNGSYDIKEFGTLPLIFSTSKYFRWKFQPWPSFFPHANIPDTWKRGQLSLEQMKKMEKVKVKSHLRYLAACSIQKKRWDIWRIFFSDFRSVFSP